MTEFTPGPWRHGTEGRGTQEAVFEQHTTDIIAMPGYNFSLINSSQTLEANARLIAAAPELLEALEMAVRFMQDENLDEALSGEFEIFTDAIAKAHGKEE